MPDFIRVIVADDHPLVRQGICGYLSIQDDIQIVGECGDGRTAVDLAKKTLPHVVLMDLVMPDMDGLEATRLIREALPETQIILLTSVGDEASILKAAQAGVVAYLLKDVAAEEMLQAVRQAAHGTATLHPRVATVLMKSFGGRPAASSSPLDGLTSRELEILRLVAHGHNNSVIANRLCLSIATVKHHVSSILTKLDIEDRTQATMIAWKHRLVSDQDAESL
jgi:NarL family two-component system response regulator LiaR